MSSWSNVDLTNISTAVELIPEGEYVFQLAPGSKFSDFDPNRVEASASIADGEYAGRRIFFSYPDPQKMDWSPKAFKRMEQALGLDANAGEGPVEYLNRAAGHRFTGQIKHRKPTEEYPNPKADLNIFNVKPSA